MMPELGKYAVAVMSAYGVTVVLLVAIIGLSLWRSARVKHALEAQEKRTDARNG